jgi:RNA polymerase sigma factor (TIGR02999 family)
MNARPPVDATQVLAEHQGGDPHAASRLLPLVYAELRALAGAYMRRERPDHTLQPTALVHEAYLRLIDITRVDWRGKSHFVAMAATQMRRVLVEHARARGAQKRGAAPQRVTLSENVAVTPEPSLDPLAFDEALERLAQLSPRQSRLAELRCFAGLDVKETAYVLGVSEATVKREWRVARAWLRHELAGSSSSG